MPAAWQPLDHSHTSQGSGSHNRISESRVVWNQQANILIQDICNLVTYLKYTTITYAETFCTPPRMLLDRKFMVCIGLHWGFKTVYSRDAKCDKHYLFRQTIDTGDAEQTQRLLFDINLIFSMHSSPSVQSAIMFLLVKASQTALFKPSNVRHLKGAQSYHLFILKSANKYCLTHARFPWRRVMV